jgi:hypothetical protein
MTGQRLSQVHGSELVKIELLFAAIHHGPETLT